MAVSPETALLRGGLKWLEVFGVSLMVFLYCSSMKRFKKIWWLLAIGSLLSAAGAWYLDFWRYNPNISLIGLEPSLLLVALRKIAAYDFLVVLCLILPFAFRYSVAVPISAVLICGIFASLSRGPIVTLMVVLGYWLKQELRHRAKIKIWPVYTLFFILLVGGTLFGLSVPLFREVLTLRLREIETVNIRLRMSLLSKAFQAFVESPLIGIGAENFAEYLFSKGAFPEGHPEVATLAPHNLFVQVAAENGIIGFFGLAVLFLNLYIILFRKATFGPETTWLLGLRLLFFVHFIGAGLLGYIGASGRLLFGLFAGLVLASLRTVEFTAKTHSRERQVFH
ncbi:MAG: O-antigen ligase family protein [Pyrobaculum sp.]